MLNHSLMTTTSSPSLERASLRQSNEMKNLKTQDDQELRLVGEERDDDAIFKIYLKRIPYKLSTTDSSHSNSKTVCDNANEQHELTGDAHTSEHGKLLYSTIKVRQLKAGSIEKIVEYLTNDTGELDTAHMHILFSTFRTYTNTRTLVDTMIARYRAVLPASLDMTEDIRQKSLKSIHTAMMCFLTTYKEAFREPPRYSNLLYFIKHVPDSDLQKQGQILLGELKTDEETMESNIDNNNNNSNSKNNYVYTEKGLDYVQPWHILDIPSKTIAEQLTIVDADLLKRVQLHECLSKSTNTGSRLSSANNSNRKLSTVEKTIEYFNAVVARVIATILKEPDEHSRATVIERWIDVAKECRLLKNFSALTAILNGLLSGCIYRLNKAWSYVTQDHRSTLEELKNVFGSCADRKQTRAILDKECTTKSTSVSLPANATLGKKSRYKTKHDLQKTTIAGAVPYLGFYLSDLTYIDSAYPNTLANEHDNDSSQKLIHFEKHRKEFDVLSQIKLFQTAANAYTNLYSLPRFTAWFNNVRTYTDTESWELSYQIEPKESMDHSSNPEQFSQQCGSPSLTSTMQRYPSEVSLDLQGTLNNCSMVTSVNSLHSSPSLTSLDKISTTSSSSFRQHLRRNQHSKSDKCSSRNHSRSSSTSSCLTSSNGSSSHFYMTSTITMPSKSSTENNPSSSSNTDETIIAKVHLSGKEELLYKKVRIRNDERTASVLKTILEKFGLDPSTYDRYCIEQQLPDRKIVLLDHCNVYYALARKSDSEQVELNVREKTRQERESKSNITLDDSGHNKVPSGLSISSNFSR